MAACQSSPQYLLNTSRHRQHDLRRDILDAIFYVVNFYVVKTGCQWQMLAGGFAPWQTVYYYFRTWNQRGVIAHLLSIARRDARQQARREPEPSAVTKEFLGIDCQSVPITRSGGLCGVDGSKKVEGRKRHIVTDTQGWTWAVKVHAADEHESQHAFRLIQQADQRSGRLEAIFADKAYRGDLEDRLDEALGLELEITESDAEAPGFSVEPKRWIVERTLGWLGGWRRLAKDAWLRRVPPWSGSRHYDWPSAASNVISKQLFNNLPLRLTGGQDIPGSFHPGDRLRPRQS
jgi:putative transposase